jgi:exopolysaccharide biosynthesis operon protein EpsL
MFRLRKLSAAITAAGALGPTPNALALLNDRVELFAAEVVTRDDNVFRLSRRVDPTPLLGRASTADTYRTTSFGLNVDLPLSRQRLLGGVAFNRIRYERFQALDLDGHEGRALWRWQLGDPLAGEAGYADRRALASLANVQGGIQSSTPNFLRTRNAWFNGAYQPTPRWRLRAEASRLQQDNSVAERRVNDVRVDGAEFTASYVSRAGNQLGLGVRFADGELPHAQPIGPLAVDNSYRQRHAFALAEWTPTGKSRLKARAGRVSRSYGQLPQRDFDAAMYYVSWEWQPTGKLTLTAIGQRDISATEEINVGFVFARAVALYPSLRLTEKLALTAAFERADREYRGDPGLVLGTVAPRTERVNAAALNLAYQPVKPVLLRLAWRRETRASSAAFGDYEANIYSIGARVGF